MISYYCNNHRYDIDLNHRHDIEFDIAYDMQYTAPSWCWHNYLVIPKAGKMVGWAHYNFFPSSYDIIEAQGSMSVQTRGTRRRRKRGRASSPCLSSPSPSSPSPLPVQPARGTLSNAGHKLVENFAGGAGFGKAVPSATLHCQPSESGRAGRIRVGSRRRAGNRGPGADSVSTERRRVGRRVCGARARGLFSPSCSNRL